MAGAVLLGWALWKGERPTVQGVRAGLILGFLFFFVSHGLLHWAELSVPSGVAALVIAIEPAIVALLLPLLRLGPAPRTATWAGLALGALNVVLLFRSDVAASPGCADRPGRSRDQRDLLVAGHRLRAEAATVERLDAAAAF